MYKTKEFSVSISWYVYVGGATSKQIWKALLSAGSFQPRQPEHWLFIPIQISVIKQQPHS